MSNEQEQSDQLDILPAGAALVRAEIDVAISTAHAFPRNEKRAVERATAMATYSQEVAEQCRYALKRRGGDGRETLIEGPSVRLAEILASCWGNVNVAARIVEINDSHVVAQGVAHDLESNYRVSTEVTRRIRGKRGRYSDDMIAVTAQAAVSIAWRNAAIRVIPRVYVDLVAGKSREVAVGNLKSLSANRDRLLDRLQKTYGIEEARACAAVRKQRREDLTQDDLAELLALGTAVHEGVHSLEECFPPVGNGKPAPATESPKGEKAEGFNLDDIEVER